jgi:hypothetical protein
MVRIECYLEFYTWMTNRKNKKDTQNIIFRNKIRYLFLNRINSMNLIGNNREKQLIKIYLLDISLLATEKI